MMLLRKRDSEKAPRVEKWRSERGKTVAYDDAGDPGVEQEDGADEEGAGQGDGDRQQEPVSEADVLLPEQEGVSVRVAGHALAAELLADGPHNFDDLHKVAGLAKVVQVERELSELQGFRSRNCRRKTRRCLRKCIVR